MSFPSIGRIVFYHSYGTPGGEYSSAERAAIVTAVPGKPTDTDYGTVVSLCVINPSGIFFDPVVRVSADGRPGTWTWPPRVG